MKTMYCFLLILCPILSKAQSISIGDKVPDIAFTQMLNSTAQTSKLSQFKGKLVILDFWATWCSACIQKFPMLDYMQQKYPAKLQVILVNPARTKDSKEKLEKFFNRFKTSQNKRLILPTIYNDSLVSSWFPNSALPLYIWIAPNQTCLAITGPDELTAKNIEAVISGNYPAFTGLDANNSFDYTKPLFVQGNAGNGEGIKFRSTLSNYIPGMRAATPTTLNNNNQVIQFKMINLPLLHMLTSAWQYVGAQNRILLSVSDSIRSALFPATDSAIKANSYCYEIICPPVKPKDIPAYLRHDLQRWFSLAGKYEKRPAACYLLTIDTAMLGRYRTKSGKTGNHLYDAENRYMQNNTLENLTRYLNSSLSRYVLQKDSITYRLDISLPDIPLTDTNAHISALAAVGITLTPSNQMIEQFIIYQLPKQQQP